MKNIIIALFISNICFAQVAIEKTSVDGSGILDFPLNTKKGIILSNVTNSLNMTPVTRGTLVFNVATANVQYYDGAWKSLNFFNTAGTPSNLLPGSDVPNVGAGVIIGNATSAAEGVLVLESSTKALILPKVENPATTVIAPAAGMICYDPVKKIIAVFNGKDWTFWK